MSPPRPFEDELLAPARQYLQASTGARVARVGEHGIALDVLEAAASRLGGFSLAHHRRLDDRSRVLTERTALDTAEVVLKAIQSSGIPPALALCALARQPLPRTTEKALGSFYTDFRLAEHVTRRVGEPNREATVVDPACGTGILLVANGMAACGLDRRAGARWIAECAWGADLSAEALSGARIALASLCDDVGAIKQMRPHLICQDSLLAPAAAWADGGRSTFDLVVANPPWEKVKATRHEFLQAQGADRHYGATYGQTSLPFAAYETHRRSVSDYAASLSSRYSALGGGEKDLYVAFTALFMKLVRPGGRVSVLLPAGLVRSQGTESLRRFLIDHELAVDFEILDNRARFFGIDTRFKFLSLVVETAGPGEAKRRPVTLRHARGTDGGVEETGRATLGRDALERLRPDLSVPEVRSAAEWRLFASMSENGEAWTDAASPWFPTIVREVDMTSDRAHFSARASSSAVPLVEGRMVHQHRFGAKGYRSGTGRRARWEPLALGGLRVEPQFWFPRAKLPGAARARVERERVGFCDITGQTNERSMLAALVPAGVVCGNKVPTITFENDPSAERLFVWLAIANSFAFDWLMRRIVTTTVNYFLLQSLPLPRIPPQSLPWRTIAAAAQRLHEIAIGEQRVENAWAAPEARVAIDLAVATAYGATYDDIVLMLNDFPLLDRGQPPLPGDERSSVTRDLILSRAAVRFGLHDRLAVERLDAALSLGALPYVPSEFAGRDGVEVEEACDGE